jgi:hypothetical protein
MSPTREAVVLPLLFLFLALIAGAEFAGGVALVPPSLFSLVLAVMLIAALVQSGALAPGRLLHASRGALANANGAMALAALFAASSQVLSMLIPRRGLPMLFVSVVLFLLLLNTVIARPDRVRLLRSLAVTLVSALLLKFVVLRALSAPAEGRTGRILAALFDIATLGTMAQTPDPPLSGYLAFFAVLIYLVGLTLLPRPGSPPSSSAELVRH